MNKVTKASIAIGAMIAPVFAFAQDGTQLFGIVGIMRTLINMLIPILLAVIFLMVIWNAFKMINADGEEKSDYKQQLTKSVIIFFVVVSIWGIVYFISKTLGIYQIDGRVSCPAGQYNPITKSCE
jgi:hypothetical protein